jgi:hypothetical protein
MIPVVFKRRHNGKRSTLQLASSPRNWKEYVTYEHSVERWYA